MRPGRRNLLILGSVAAAAAAAGGLVGVLALQARSGVGELLSRAFPDAAGNHQRLANWAGRPLLCNFWATWCAPCREEMPLFEAVHAAYGPRGLQVVGIAVDNRRNVDEFAEKVRVTYPILIGGAGAVDLMRQLGNGAGALPFTVLLDRRGRLAGTKLGAYTPAELDKTATRLLQ